MTMPIAESLRPALLSLAILGIALPCAAQAEEKGVVYAGGSTGGGNNGYAGMVIALPGSRLGKGPAIRVGGSAGDFRYDASGTTISSTYTSAEVALVMQTSGDWGWANFSAGPRVTHTGLTPNDPANKQRGTRLDGVISTDGALGYRWRMVWFGSLGVRDTGYVTEARFGPLIDEPHQTRIGVEAGVQGDNNYTRYKGGAFASTQFVPTWEGRVSLGVADQKGIKSNVYGALALSHTF